MSAGQQSNLC